MNRRTFLAALAALVGWKAKPEPVEPRTVAIFLNASDRDILLNGFVTEVMLFEKRSPADAKISAIAREYDALQQQPAGPMLVQSFDEQGKLIKRRTA